MKKKFSVGIIGCGGIAKVHANCIDRINIFEIKKTYDIIPELAKKLAYYHNATPSKKINEIFDDPEIDIVYICTRNDTHVKLSIDAIKSGKHVFCEKPLAMSLKEAYLLDKVLKESKKKLMVGFNMRFTPSIKRMVELIENDNFNLKICNINISPPQFLNGRSGLPKEGGGVLPSLGSHALDLCRYLVKDKIVKINCLAKRFELEDPYLENAAILMICFDSGVIASISINDQNTKGFSYSPGNNLVEVQINGGNGSYKAIGYSHLVYSTGDNYILEKFPVDCREYAWGYLEENIVFSKVISGENINYPGIEDGLEVTRLIEAAAKSNIKKEWILLN